MQIWFTTFFLLIFSPLSMAQGDVRFKISYNFIHDIITPHGIKYNYATQIQENIILSGKNKVTENSQWKAGFSSISETKDKYLGKHNGWKVLNKKTLMQTRNYKTFISSVTLTMTSEKTCSIKVQRTLKKGYTYFESRSISTRQATQWTNPRFSNQTCEVL